MGVRQSRHPLLLAIEPTGELALPSAFGVRFLGIEVAERRGWPSLRHVFDVGADDAALFVEIGPLGEPEAYAVGYSPSLDEILTPL